MGKIYETPNCGDVLRKGKKVIDRGQTFSGACGGGCLDVGPWEWEYEMKQEKAMRGVKNVW